MITLVAALLTQPSSASAQRPPRTAAADTIAQTDSVQISARGALLRSFAIPGWGQTYAGAPGRGAIYFAMEAGSLWMVYKTRQQLAASRVRDRWLRSRGQLDDDEISPLSRSRAQQFEDWVTLAVFVALFSGADAYVTAQLADFAEHVGVRPTAAGVLEMRIDLSPTRR